MLQKLEKILFYLLIFCLPLQIRHIFYSFGAFNEWRSVYLYGTDILILGLLVFWAARMVKEKKASIQCGRTELALGVFLLISALSLVVATNLKLGIYSYFKLLEFSALFLYIKNIFFEFKTEKFWHVFIAGALAQSIIGIIQFLKQSSLGLRFLTESPIAPDLDGVAKIAVNGEKIIRAYGLTPHPNILAAILMIAIFGLAWLWITKDTQCHSDESQNPDPKESGSRVKPGMTTGREWVGRVVYVLSLFILSAGLFFTFSRAIMAIGFFLLIAWLGALAVKNKLYRKYILPFFLLFAICYSLLAIFYWPLISNRFSSADIFFGQSLNLRSYYNQVAIEFIQKSPVWGIGQGNFVNYFSESSKWLQGWIVQPVHNIYLLIAAETGLLGLLVFLWLVFEVGWRGIKGLKNKILSPDGCFIFILCFILATGFFDHFWLDQQQGQILFWLMLGALASFVNKKELPS